MGEDSPLCGQRLDDLGDIFQFLCFCDDPCGAGGAPWEIPQGIPCRGQSWAGNKSPHLVLRWFVPLKAGRSPQVQSRGWRWFPIPGREDWEQKHQIPLAGDRFLLQTNQTWEGTSQSRCCTSKPNRFWVTVCISQCPVDVSSWNALCPGLKELLPGGGEGGGCQVAAEEQQCLGTLHWCQ